MSLAGTATVSLSSFRLIKKLGKKKHDMSKSDIRKECRKHADKFIDTQRQGFIRLGGFGDWYNPYITMDFKYEAKTLEELYRFFDNGGVYKGLKLYTGVQAVQRLSQRQRLSMTTILPHRSS